MSLKKFINNLPLTDNADSKISTKGFVIFGSIMIFLILLLVVLLTFL